MSDYHCRQPQQQQTTAGVTHPGRIQRDAPLRRSRRRTQLCNRVTCGAFMVTMVIICGVVLCKLGIIFTATNNNVYLLMVLTGVGLIGFGIYLCCVTSSICEKRHYHTKNLARPARPRQRTAPSAHQDSHHTQRALIEQPGTSQAQPDTYPTHSSPTQPSPTQPSPTQPSPTQPSTYQPPTSTHLPPQYVFPSGQPVTGGHSGRYPTTAGHTHPSAPPPPRAPHYMDDPPPPYSEVCKT